MSKEWVGSRDIKEYRSKWQSVFDTAGDNEVTYVTILDDAVVGSVRVAQLQSSEFDAQLVGMHVEPGRPWNSQSSDEPCKGIFRRTGG